MISQTRMKNLWVKGEHKEVAKWLPYFYDKEYDLFIEQLKKSNLSQLKRKLELPPITLGADPEFILAEKANPSNIVMFNSSLCRYNSPFEVASAEIGADYGLLEFRIPISKSANELTANVNKLHKDFEKGYEDLIILKTEAIEYNHQLARIKNDIKTKLETGETPLYGGYHGKETAVWSAGQMDGNEELVLDENSTATLCAYDKPEFKKYNPAILSAGGHIHIGGTFIKCLSISQLNVLVKKFDEIVLPIIETIATENGDLRKSVYGSKGEYRLKEYGIEWRTPSNMVFMHEHTKILTEVLELMVDLTVNHLVNEE